MLLTFRTSSLNVPPESGAYPIRKCDWLSFKRSLLSGRPAALSNDAYTQNFA
jgi:hypothetical protein